jgi:hypothetical protein
MIGARGLNDADDGTNDGLKWKLADQSASEITFLPLVRYRHFVVADESVLKYYSQTGRLTDSAWGGRFGVRRRGHHGAPRHGLIG